MHDYLNVIHYNYASFQGRARRREYWMFTLINSVTVFILEIPLPISLPSLRPPWTAARPCPPCLPWRP